MSDYFYSLEMCLRLHNVNGGKWLVFHNSALDTTVLADEENQ